VDVDDAVTRSFQIGLEGEHSALIGDVGVLRLERIHQLHPRQQTCTR
ncbi:uncharacterized, partial [Tachysurus ichikawai]